MQQDYGNMPIEDFTHGLYKNVKALVALAWFNLILSAGNIIYWILWARIPSFY